MAPKSRSILLVFLSVLVVSILNEASALGGRGATVGGWQPIDDVKSPEVEKIANFAVTEHNKEAKTALKFVSLIKGETQVVSGTNYRLVISAEDGGASGSKNYIAVVWSQPWGKTPLQLTSFEEVKG